MEEYQKSLATYFITDSASSPTVSNSLIPRRSVIGEKSAWYPLFAHARLPRVLSVLYDCTLLKHRCCLHLQDAALLNQAVPYTLSKVGKGDFSEGGLGTRLGKCMAAYGQVEFIYVWGLTVCIVVHAHFGKAETAYCRPQYTSLNIKFVCDISAYVS